MTLREQVQNLIVWKLAVKAFSLRAVLLQECFSIELECIRDVRVGGESYGWSFVDDVLNVGSL